MIEQPVADLPVATPRRLVVRALLRASLTATVLVVLYFMLPITGSLDGSAAMLLVVGLLAFAGVVSWQVRAVLRSRYPGLRAIEALAAAIPLFLLVFAVAYVLMADADGGAFSEPLSRTDALYFTVTVFSKVGFGDITPKTGLARIATTVQMLADLLVLGLVLRVMVGAVKAGLQRRAAASARFPDSSHQGNAGPGPTHMLPGRTALDLDSGGHWTCWKRSAGIARTVVTFATWLEDGGIPTRVIDELMGHRGGARREWEASRIGLRYRHTADEMHRAWWPRSTSAWPRSSLSSILVGVAGFEPATSAV